MNARRLDELTRRGPLQPSRTGSPPSVWCEPCRTTVGLSTTPIRAGLLSTPYRALTVGIVGLVALGAFETLAVATAMPAVAADLGGLGAYALAFGVSTATGIVGMVLGGQWADTRGPAAVVRLGVALMVAGLLLCGAAPTMAVLVAGRAVQGLGTGLLGVALFVVVGLCYPEDLRPPMFAAFATAWMVPALIGPVISGLVVDALGWRWVFFVVAVVAVPAAMPVLQRLGPRQLVQPARRPPARSGRLRWAVSAGVGAAVLQLTGQLPVWAAAALGGLSALMLAGSAQRLLPAGTLRARSGLPTIVLLRGLSAGGFVGAQVLLPLVLVSTRGLAPAAAGLVLSVGSVAWAGASWVRGRMSANGEHRLLQTGLASLFLGIISALLLIATSGPTVGFVASWTAASAGMGLVVPTLSVLALRQVAADERGTISADLQISDSMFAALALALTSAVFTWLLSGGIAPYVAGFAIASTLPLIGLVVAHRAKLSGVSPTNFRDPAQIGRAA
jgi:MFS family permease